MWKHHHQASSLVAAVARQRRRRRLPYQSSSSWSAAAIAATTLVGAASFPQQQDDQQEDEHNMDRRLDYYHHNESLLLLPTTTTTQCDLMVPSRWLTGGKHSDEEDEDDDDLTTAPRLLKRHTTVEWLHETASKDSLESLYQVNFDDPQALIGSGAFGNVYQGTHRATGEAVAIKRIPKEFTSNASFQTEMDALLYIRQVGGHPGICGLRQNFEDNENNEYYYLVLDLVQGGEVFEYLCRNGAFSEAQASRLFRQVASSLDFLHQQHLVHCDLKPENLLLSQKHAHQAQVKLVDFGCARLEVTNSPQAAVGSGATAAYCPPEVLQELTSNSGKNVPVHASFDMWSLGIILYAMLTGIHPFDPKGNATDQEIADRILNHKLPPRKYTAHLSKDACQVLEGLICWDPKQRWTAAQLLQHPWVLGTTATSKTIHQSDRRLATFKKHQTKVGASFFKGMIDHAKRKKTVTRQESGSKGKGANNNNSSPLSGHERTSLVEAAFTRLDASNRGYVSTKELQGDESFFGADARLNLAEASELLSETMKDVYLPKGHIAYRQGDRGDDMYFINSGTIQVTSKDGFLVTRSAGEFYGEDALLSADHCRIHTVECITPVHAIQVSRQDFEKYIAADEDVGLTMQENLRFRKREKVKTMLGMQKSMKYQDAKRNEVIFERGSKGNTLYLVDQGQVEISVQGHVVRNLGPGEMTGEHAAYFSHKPYNVTAKCVSKTGCRLAAIAGADMHRLFAKNPPLKEHFHDIILRRDFKKAVCHALERKFPETEEELQAAFSDLDVTGKGALELDRLEGIMKAFDPTYSDEDIRILLKSMDLNNSGSLTWQEFKSIFGMAQEN